MRSEERYTASVADELGAAHYGFVKAIAAHLAESREEAAGFGAATQTRGCRIE